MVRTARPVAPGRGTGHPINHESSSANASFAPPQCMSLTLWGLSAPRISCRLNGIFLARD